MNLELKFNFNFEDLYSSIGIKNLDNQFLNYLHTVNSEVFYKLEKSRTYKVVGKVYSDLIIEVSKYLEEFIGYFFNIEKDIEELILSHKGLNPIFLCKKLFIQKIASKKYTKEQVLLFNYTEIEKSLFGLLNIDTFQEINFSIAILEWIKNKEESKLDIAARYVCCILHLEEEKNLHHRSILFNLPKKIDVDNLVNYTSYTEDGVESLLFSDDKLVNRKGFSLTDPGSSLKFALDQTNYCIHCHNQQKDSCSKGFKFNGVNNYTSTSKTQIDGCPLEEKISEMNLLKSEGFPIASLAVAIIDNPMLAATGHRICNACMKSCIYQKQEPVNIPEIETRVLKDVLNLPWGFEIYSLLTRWNPLNLTTPFPKQDSNYKILVVGLGPAGFTLAHYLLNEGHTVVGIDGLKIEPLPSNISGVDYYGNRTKFEPIYNVNKLFEELDQRVAYGFGGVEEYGITVRWNKNYLKIIRLLLERRQNFKMFGGIRFGSNISYDKAWELGFNHIALSIGAGAPNLLNMPNSLIKGIRTASDFLMSLQLGGAGRINSLTNLEMRLPLLVVGGGLTAIDSATEALAYYPVQLEKFHNHLKKVGIQKFQEILSQEEKKIFQEYYLHSQELLQEKLSAEIENREPNLIKLLKKWGGVKVIYRKALKESPSYRLNHEEVNNAFKEGIEFIENTELLKINIDEFNNVKSITVKHKNKEIDINAKNIILALGTNSNTSLAEEYPNHFHLNGKNFDFIANISTQTTSQLNQNNFIISLEHTNRAVSVFGDAHPSYNGNVVKAMASAKHGYSQITSILNNSKPSSISQKKFFSHLDYFLTATVKQIKYLTPNIVELIIKAPLAAEEFKPGQFYKLQNYELYKANNNSIKYGMEPLAMTGAFTNKSKGLISMIALLIGGSSNLCTNLQKNEPVILMGPTGKATYIPYNEKVLLIGGGLGNAVLFSIGKAMKDQNCQVLYLAGYKKSIDVYKMKEIEEACDSLILTCEEKHLDIHRPQDFSYLGNIIEAIEKYNQEKGNLLIQLSNIDRIIVIGSAGMMEAVAQNLRTKFKQFFKKSYCAIASINSPMQCMMKGICAQCLQRHFDPETGLETYVYSCVNQDQDLEKVDFSHLHSRLGQNSLQEKLTTNLSNHPDKL